MQQPKNILEPQGTDAQNAMAQPSSRVQYLHRSPLGDGRLAASRGERLRPQSNDSLPDTPAAQALHTDAVGESGGPTPRTLTLPSPRLGGFDDPRPSRSTQKTVVIQVASAASLEVAALPEPLQQAEPQHGRYSKYFAPGLVNTGEFARQLRRLLGNAEIPDEESLVTEATVADNVQDANFVSSAPDMRTSEAGAHESLQPFISDSMSEGLFSQDDRRVETDVCSPFKQDWEDDPNPDGASAAFVQADDASLSIPAIEPTLDKGFPAGAEVAVAAHEGPCEANQKSATNGANSAPFVKSDPLKDGPFPERNSRFDLPRVPHWMRARRVKLRRVANSTRPMSRLEKRALYGILAFFAAAFGSLAGLTMVYSLDLPQVSMLEQFRPNATTEIYDVHGWQVGSFALERRDLVDYSDLPMVLRDAVVSIEDKSFDNHSGVNYLRVLGAAYRDIVSQERRQGASTLTMQLSRNLFLSHERSFGRKLQEALFSIQLEHRLTKAQIFTLYANQIYLGHGMYGFEAASHFYFNKRARDLDLQQAALLAGLPKSPVGYSPLLHPARALERRNIVLHEMRLDGRITPQQEDDARITPLDLHMQPPSNSEAPWFVEELRQTLELDFGPDEVRTGGLKVFTGLDIDLQRTANDAVLGGLAAYERRHGWKGHLQRVDAATFRHADWLAPISDGSYVHGVVTAAEADQVAVNIGERSVLLRPADWSWTGFRSAKQFLQPGDVVYLRIMADGGALHARLEQDSGAQAALLAIDNQTGSVVAMVGGRDFQLSQFNRATQAHRQTGSSFKPYVYAAAVEGGARPNDHIEDTPATFAAAYSPHDFDNTFRGGMTLLSAFATSRNVPAVRLAASVGMRKITDLARRCGIASDIPPYLPSALGAASLTLQEQVSGFSVFANDGLHVPIRLERRVTTGEGRELRRANGEITSAMAPATAQTMLTLLQEVVRSGTGVAARSLNHPLGGKSGTTSSFTDAWFVGFSPSVTTGVWIGYDDRTSLGDRETGSGAALPIWIKFMRAVDAGHPGERFTVVRRPAPAPRRPALEITAETAKPPAQASAQEKVKADDASADAAQLKNAALQPKRPEQPIAVATARGR